MTAPAVSRGTSPRPVTVLDDVLLELVDVGANIRIDPGELEELAASIRELGVLEPIKVTTQLDGRYRVVFGQRRVLAARLASQLRIPAIVEPPSDVDEHGARRSIEQLTENLQRKDLNPIEEAVALREVLDADPDLTQEALADKLGRSRPWVSNTLGLLAAAPSVQAHVREGRLTASHVTALRGLAPKTQIEVATRAIEQGASAHSVEGIVQNLKRNEEWRKEQDARSRKEAEARKTTYTAAITKKLGKEPRDVKIVVSSYGMGRPDGVVAALKAAGLTNVTIASGGVTSRPKGGCTCVGWKVETTYDGVRIVPGCFNVKHQAAAAELDEQGRQARYELETRVRARLQAEAPAWISLAEDGIRMASLLARMALWGILGYSVADWAAGRGGKRNAPWAALAALSDAEVAAELGKKIASDFRDNYGYRVDWSALAVELGLEMASPEQIAAAGVDVAVDDDAVS